MGCSLAKKHVDPLAPERIISRPVRKRKYPSVAVDIHHPKVKNPADKTQEDTADDSTICIDDVSPDMSISTQRSYPKEAHIYGESERSTRSTDLKEAYGEESVQFSRHSSHFGCSSTTSVTFANSVENSVEIRKGDYVRLRTKSLRGTVAKMKGSESCFVVFYEAKHLGLVLCRTADLKVLQSGKP